MVQARFRANEDGNRLGVYRIGAFLVPLSSIARVTHATILSLPLPHLIRAPSVPFVSLSQERIKDLLIQGNRQLKHMQGPMQLSSPGSGFTPLRGTRAQI